MEYKNEKINKGPEINIARLFENILKKWWLILLLTVAVAFGGLGISKVTVQKTYTSGISFVVNLSSGSKNENDTSYNDINGSIKIANTFAYILSSRILYDKVVNDCAAYGVTEKELTNSVKVTTAEETNVIEMTVTTDSAAKSKAIADSVVNNYEDVVKNAYSSIKLSVINPPVKASEPDEDYSTVRNIIIGAFVGFAAAVLIIIISNAAKGTVTEAEEIEDKMNLPVLGSVSHIEKKNGSGGGKDRRSLLITDLSTGFSFVETYKAIRTKIESSAAKNDYKTIMISSATENEGKTTVATNIAIGLAQNGKSVLLIDADLRKPSVYRALGIKPSAERGVADVVSGKCSFSKAIGYAERYGLYLLAGSQSVKNASEILSSAGMEKIIKNAEAEFDYVIIDTAPAGVVTDASVITNYADGIIMVIREDSATVGKIVSTIDDLSNGKAKFIGCVFNNVKKSMSRKYYGKRYGGYGKRYGYGGYSKSYSYGYGYGYGYGNSRKDSEETKKSKSEYEEYVEIDIDNN